MISTSLALNSSSNPSGYKDNVNFGAMVVPATAAGTVQFLTNGVAFDSEILSGGHAVSTNLASLPRGANVITAIYSGDANDAPATNTLGQITTNHPPVATPAFYTRAAGFPLYIELADLATNWMDVDGDVISLVAIGVSTNGVTITNNDGMLDYFNSSSVPDQFICTLSDGWGGTNFQTVSIAVVAPVNSTPAILGVVGGTNGSFTLSLGGAPGLTYILESTAAFGSSGNWVPLATNTVGANGVWEFTDAQAGTFQQRFYRLVLAP